MLPERTVASITARVPSSVAVAPVGLLVAAGVVDVAAWSSILHVNDCIIFVGEGSVLVRVVVRLHVGPVRIKPGYTVVSIKSLRRGVSDVGWGIGVAHHRAVFRVTVVHWPSHVLRSLLIEVTLSLSWVLLIEILSLVVIEILSLVVIEVTLTLVVEVTLTLVALIERVSLSLASVAVVVVVLVVVLLVWSTIDWGLLWVALLPVVVHLALIHGLIHLVTLLAIHLILVHLGFLLSAHHYSCDDRSQNQSDSDRYEQPSPPGKTS